MNIGIYIYNDAEVLDFSGPFEVFSTARRLGGNDWQVFLVAEDETVRARGDFMVRPHYGLDEHPPIDVLVVAGGIHSAELGKPPVIDWIARTASTAGTVASVCTGAFLLAEAGLLDGLTVTTHWEDIPDLRAGYPGLEVVEDRRWVSQDRFVTSAGISAGIDMSLYLVSRLASVQLAERTARQMDYDWRQQA